MSLVRTGLRAKARSHRLGADQGSTVEVRLPPRRSTKRSSSSSSITNPAALAKRRKLTTGTARSSSPRRSDAQGNCFCAIRTRRSSSLTDPRSITATALTRSLASSSRGDAQGDVVVVAGAGCTHPFGGASLVDAEPFGEDRGGEPAGKREKRGVAGGSAGDAIGLESVPQAVAAEVATGFLTAHQPAFRVGGSDALGAHGERDGSERLRQRDGAAGERDRGLPVWSGDDVGGLERRDTGDGCA